MIGERHIAVFALRHPSAHATLNHWREAAAVLEQNNLLTLTESLAHSLQQLGRKGTVHQLAVSQILDVNHLCFGQFYPTKPCGERCKTVFSGLRIVVTFHRRRSCSQHGLGVKHARQHNSHTACMVAGRGVLLLKARLVFLINNNKTQLLERQKDGTTRPQHHIVGTRRELAAPYFYAFGIAVL